MKSLTKIVSFLTVTGAFFAAAMSPAFALNSYGGQGLMQSVNRMENQASREATRSADQLQNIINRGNNLISVRLSSLNDINTRIENDNNLSSSEKSSLSSNVQTDISGLTALKTKLDADTDVTTARADEKSIITSYYIYAMFDPKIRLLIVLNNLSSVTANLQTLVPQLQNLINTFQSQGKNVTALQTLLNSISSELTTINTTLSNDTTTIQNVSVSTTDPSATFTQVRSDITNIVRSGLASIKSDFSQMRPLFKQLIENTATSSTTPTVTSSAVSPTAVPTTSTP